MFSIIFPVLSIATLLASAYFMSIGDTHYMAYFMGLAILNTIATYKD